jgi:hypothetical protein
VVWSGEVRLKPETDEAQPGLESEFVDPALPRVANIRYQTSVAYRNGFDDHSPVERT